VTAVIVDVEPEVTARVRDKWVQWGQRIPLVVLDSPYRSTIGPLLAYLDQVDSHEPERGLAVLMLPEFVPAHWWQDLLHNQTARYLKRALIYRRGRTGKDRVIIDVPYHLRQ
ncbi:MAG: amino acid permease, partial [Anaerolineae bacterium]